MGPTGAEEAGLCSTYLGKRMCGGVRTHVFASAVAHLVGRRWGIVILSVLRELLANQICFSLALKPRH